MPSRSLAVIKKNLEESGLLTTYIYRPSAPKNGFTIYNDLDKLFEIHAKNDGEKRIIFDPIGLTDNIIEIDKDYLGLDMTNTTWSLSNTYYPVDLNLGNQQIPRIKFNKELTFSVPPTFKNTTGTASLSIEVNNQINPVIENVNSDLLSLLDINDLDVRNNGSQSFYKSTVNNGQVLLLLNNFKTLTSTTEVFEISNTLVGIMRVNNFCNIVFDTIKGNSNITLERIDLASDINSTQSNFTGSLIPDLKSKLSRGDNDVPFLT